MDNSINCRCLGFSDHHSIAKHMW